MAKQLDQDLNCRVSAPKALASLSSLNVKQALHHLSGNYTQEAGCLEPVSGVFPKCKIPSSWVHQEVLCKY